MEPLPGTPRPSTNDLRRKRLVRWGLSAFFGLISLGLVLAALGPSLRGEPDSVGQVSADSSTERAGSSTLLALPGWESLTAEQGVGSPTETTGQGGLTETTETTIRIPGIDPETAGDPERVVIPSIDVDSKLVGVGLEDDGTMQTPDFGLAAWYDVGPKPGAVGAAVIVAHVDSKAGPDVFYRLRELDVGDRVQVTYPEGRLVTFEVEAREQIAKSELPVDRIWNQTPEPVLRLITCGGEFDRSTGHYRSNVIVYASFVSAG